MESGRSMLRWRPERLGRCPGLWVDLSSEKRSRVVERLFGLEVEHGTRGLPGLSLRPVTIQEVARRTYSKYKQRCCIVDTVGWHSPESTGCRLPCTLYDLFGWMRGQYNFSVFMDREHKLDPSGGWKAPCFFVASARTTCSDRIRMKTLKLKYQTIGWPRTK